MLPAGVFGADVVVAVLRVGETFAELVSNDCTLISHMIKVKFYDSVSTYSGQIDPPQNSPSKIDPRQVEVGISPDLIVWSFDICKCCIENFQNFLFQRHEVF